MQEKNRPSDNLGRRPPKSLGVDGILYRIYGGRQNLPVNTGTWGPGQQDIRDEFQAAIHTIETVLTRCPAVMHII